MFFAAIRRIIRSDNRISTNSGQLGRRTQNRRIYQYRRRRRHLRHRSQRTLQLHRQLAHGVGHHGHLQEILLGGHQCRRAVPLQYRPGLAYLSAGGLSANDIGGWSCGINLGGGADFSVARNWDLSQASSG